MICYECSRTGKREEAVALCHHCSAALCTDHTEVIFENVLGRAPMLKEVVLPEKGRRLLCQTCKSALEQPPLESHTSSERGADESSITVSSAL